MSSSAGSTKPDLSQYVIRPANPTQAKQVVDWGRRYFMPNADEKAWYEYKNYMLSQEYYQDGRYIPWVLVKVGAEDGEAYSHVETARRDGWIKDENGIRNIGTYAVTFVSTPERHKRKGYSRRLLRSLHYFLNPSTGWPFTDCVPPTLPPGYDIPPATASYLSSVAPPGFYEGALIGPDAAHRQGWIARAHENGEIVVPVPQRSAGASASADKNWSWLYPKDITPDLAQSLSSAKRRKLESTAVAKGAAIMAVDPASPGLLTGRFFEYHFLSGANYENRGPTPAATPIGLRFEESDDAALVLFNNHIWSSGELSITMMSNVAASHLDTVLEAISDPLFGCDSLKFWGMTRDDGLAKELIKRGGEFRLRCDPSQFMPFGVAWYGEADVEARFDGTEMWMWT